MTQLYGPGPADPPPLIATRDLAGLTTTDVEDRPVGELFGALSEGPTGLIRYLDVSLARTARHVLVPIGHARIDTGSARPACRLRAATYEDLLAVPDYDPDDTDLDTDYHERVLQAHGALFYGARYYAHPAFDHSALTAGDAPVIAVETEEGSAPEPEPAPVESGLVSLSTFSGRALARPAADLRGRPVLDAVGEEVGTVADLLIERGAGQPRYAVIALDEPARQTVLPLGFLSPAGDEEQLAVRSLGVEDIRLLPAYDGLLTRAEENRLRAALEGRLSGDRYFERPDFRGR